MVLAESLALAAVNLASDALVFIPLIYVAVVAPALIALGLMLRATMGGGGVSGVRSATAGGPT